MKKLLFALTFMCGAAFAVNAQEVQDQPSTDYRTEDQDTREADQDLENVNQPESETQDMMDDNSEAESLGGQEQEREAEFDSEKQLISTTDLPSSITEQIASDDYSGWSIERSYRKEKDGEKYYVVELAKDGENKVVKFDEEGNKVKEKMKDKE